MSIIDADITMSQEETLEDAIGQVEAIIKQMEGSDVSLEASFQLYQQGIEKLKNCNEMLDTVEKKMLKMTEDGDLEDF